MIVNEAGASVYSASQAGAAEEFPDFDVNLRSAVSIARRLQDPLAELVKIDPKAIGVGQYQHDMPQKQLERGACRRGGGLCQRRGRGREHRLRSPARRTSPASTQPPRRTSSPTGRRTAPSPAGRQLLKVPKLGPKAFEQCAGFLRVPESTSGARPHRRPSGELRRGAGAARRSAAIRWRTCATGRSACSRQTAEALSARRRLPRSCGIGVPTLRDIVRELTKPRP